MNFDIERARKGVEHWNDWAAKSPGHAVNFTNEHLSNVPSFEGFHFPGDAIFTGATIQHGLSFANTIFDGHAHFNKAQFAVGLNFQGAKFREIANFSNTSIIDGVVDFSKSEFEMDFIFSVDKYHQNQEKNIRNIPKISFHGCKFHGDADFSNRIFQDDTDFTVRYFLRAPKFYRASIDPGTKFGNIDEIFKGYKHVGSEKRYQVLKLAMNQHRARTEEADFAALELKARRHRLKREASKTAMPKRCLLWLEHGGYLMWEALSKSGRSFFRPLASYVASWLTFATLYVLPCQGWHRDWGVSIQYSFMKQFPFAAAFRGGQNHIHEMEKILFGLNDGGLLPGLVVYLNSIQAILALIMIFLMGIGIRHKFRLR